MSSGPDTAEIIAEYDSLFVSFICSFTALTFISYDWLLNLDEEIGLFWQRKVTAGSILYFLIRYLVIVYWIIGYPSGPVKGVGCDVYLYTIFVLQLLILVFPALFSTLRVYALTGQSKVLALVTLFFALGPVYANAINYGWWKPEYLGPDIGCSVVDSSGHKLGVMFTGISRGMLSVADLLVISITWVKTSYIVRDLRDVVGPSITKTLLYSGVIYYIPLAVLNVLHMILTEIGAEQFLRNSSLISVFLDPVTSVLASHFLLNLRRVEVGRQSYQTTDDSATLRFTRDGNAQTLPPFIASFGELVDMCFGNDDSVHGVSDDTQLTLREPSLEKDEDTGEMTAVAPLRSDQEVAGVARADTIC